MDEESVVAGRARFVARARRLADHAFRLNDVTAARELADMGAAALQLLVDRMIDREDGAAAVLDAVLAEIERAGTQAVVRELTLDEPRLRALLVDPQPIARRVAVTLLGLTGDAGWMRPLGRVLREDPEPLVRRATVDALARLESPDVLRELSSGVEGTRDEIRYDAIRAIGRLGPAGCWYLVPVAVEHSDPGIRSAAAEALARCADAAAWEALLTRLQSARSHEVRRALVEGLGRSRAVRAARVLVRALVEDESPMVRQAAADALPRLRDTRVMGALVESALYDPYDEPHGSPAPDGSQKMRYPVREAAADALLVLGGTEALASLEHVPSLVAMPG